MASGGRDPMRHRRSRNAGRTAATNPLATAPKHISDEELARRLQSEEEDMLFESDRMTAHHLQDQYSGMRLYNDLATAERADNVEKAEATKSDEEYAREISDTQLAYKLQMEMDQELAARLTEEETSKPGQSGRVTRRLTNPALPGTSSTSAGADETDGSMTPFVDNQGTMFIPEQFLPFFAAQTGGGPSGRVHPALRQMRPAFSTDQWAAIQVNPMNFLLQMMHGAAPAFASDSFSGNDYESLWELAESLGEVRNRGMTEDELNVLPTSQYTGQNSPRDNDEDDKNCKVCLNEFSPGDTLRTLPCLHKFHAECIDQWMQRRAVCPICRLEVKENLGPGNDDNDS